MYMSDLYFDRSSLLSEVLNVKKIPHDIVYKLEGLISSSK